MTTVRLQRLLAPIASRHQIVHGDLAGNPLWADGLPPAVIDFTPYWRPAGYGTALLIVDAVLWYGAEPSMLRHAQTDSEGDQLLVRALLFRLSVDALQLSDPSSAVTAASSHIRWNLEHAEPLVALLETSRSTPQPAVREEQLPVDPLTVR